MRMPDYEGGGLVNLVAELEHRLTGASRSPRLDPRIGEAIPPAPSYLLFLFDGLGDGQLSHPRAAALAAARRAALDAPFPTTTSTSLASLATGVAPARHGLIGYQLWLPEHDLVVNTLKWTTLWGEPVEMATEDFLPAPNLWERMDGAGIETVTVQPGQFLDTPLSRLLYRGTRFEPFWTAAELVEACLVLADRPGRLVVAYLPHVDVAAHTHGQGSEEYADSLALAARIWERTVTRLPSGVTALGTADHGHVDIPPERQVEIPSPAQAGLTFYGDSRATFVRGDPSRTLGLSASLPAAWVPREELAPLWGPGPTHPELDGRAPDGALMAEPGHSLLHRFSDRRLIGAHGGLTEEEVRVPLLVATRPGNE